MTNSFSRRQFLSGAAAAASVTLLSPLLTTQNVAWAAAGVRRDIGGMTAYDPIVVSYATAIRPMRLCLQQIH